MGGCLRCSLIGVMLNHRSLRGTYYYHLNIKEIDHIIFITKMAHVMFHETVSRKLLVFKLHVEGSFPSNLLDELITTFGVLFLVFFFFIQISS